MSGKNQWFCINTKANPADLASRGLLPNELIENNLWWHGPSVLLNEGNIPENEKSFETHMERKSPKTLSMFVRCNHLDRFSNFERAKRVLAFCQKYIQKLKEKRNLTL